MEPFDTWRQDEEFNALSEDAKARTYVHFFTENFVDDEFRALPEDQQIQILNNFLSEQGLKVAPTAQEPPAADDSAWGQIKEGYDQAMKGDPPFLSRGDPEKIRAAQRTLENIGQVYPVGEAAASLVSGLYGGAAGGIVGGVAGIEHEEPPPLMEMLADPSFIPGKPPGKLGFNPNRAAKVMEKVQEVLSYQPQTQRGKELTETVTAPLKLLGKGAEKVGDYIFEKTDSPVLGAIAKTGIEALPLFLPLILRTIQNTNAFRRATIKDRRLVVQSLEKTLEKNPHLTEGQLIRKSDQYFKEAAARRAKGETPQPKAPVGKPRPHASQEVAGHLPPGQGFEIVGEHPRGFDVVPSQAAYVGPDGIVRMPEKGLPAAAKPAGPGPKAPVPLQPIPVRPKKTEVDQKPSPIEERAEKVFEEDASLPPEQERLRRRKKMAQAKTEALTKKQKGSIQALRKRIDSLGARLETEKRPVQRKRLERAIQQAGQQLKEKMRASQAETTTPAAQVQGTPVPVEDVTEPVKTRTAPEVSILSGEEHREADRRQSVINERYGRSPERRSGYDRREPPLIPERKVGEIGDFAVRSLKKKLTEALAHEKVPLEPPAHVQKPTETPQAKQPWEMTREEFLGGSPKGFKVERLPGEDIARAEPDGVITLDPDKFFGHNVSDRKDIISHERAHFLEEKIRPEDKAKYFDVPGIMNYRGRNINEKLANMIQDGKVPPEVLKDYPELTKPEAAKGPAIDDQVEDKGKVSTEFDQKIEQSRKDRKDQQDREERIDAARTNLQRVYSVFSDEAGSFESKLTANIEKWASDKTQETPSRLYGRPKDGRPYEGRQLQNKTGTNAIEQRARVIAAQTKRPAAWVIVKDEAGIPTYGFVSEFPNATKSPTHAETFAQTFLFESEMNATVGIEFPAPSKKQKALTEYQDYIKALSDEQKKAAGDLIKETPAFPTAQKRKIEKVLADKPTPKTPIKSKPIPIKKLNEAAIGQPDKRIAFLRKSADSLQKQIDEKNNPATAQQNITARRANIIAGMAKQAESLQKTQTAMRGMADAIEAGTLPESLQGLKSKPQIDEVLRVSKWEYARPTVRRDDLHEVVDSIKGVRGSVKIKDAVSSILRRPITKPGGYVVEIRNQNEAKAVETLLRFADKHGKGIQTGSWGPVGRVRGDLRDGKRLLSAGIDTEAKFDAAKKDLEQYIKPPSKKDLQKKKLQGLEHGLIGTKIPGFFPTPKPVITRMLEEAKIESGMKVLEPSAGKGDIADAIKDEGVTPDVVEFSGTLKSILEAKGYEIKGADFLEYDQGGYDRIVMNPPFEKGQDIEHVQHAYKLLRPGGRLVSIMSEGPFFRGDTKSEKFRDWLETVGGTSEKLTEGSFKGKESFRQTGTATRLVVIGKPTKASKKKLPSGTTLYSGIPIDAMLDQIKKFRVDIPEKDITLLRQVSSVPHWVAKVEPNFKVVQEIIEERFHNKNVIKNGYLQDLLPTFKALSKKEATRVGDVLWRGDELGMVLSEKGLAKLSPNEQAAYETVRDVLDFVRDDLLELLGQLKVPKTEIDKIRRMFNEWTGFMPHPREGKYFARAIEDGKVVWRKHFDDLLATMTRGKYGWRSPFVQKKLQKMFPEAFVELGKNLKDLSEESYFEVNPVATQQLLDAVINDLKYSDTFKEDLKASLEKGAADLFNVRGFMSHAKKRQNIPGFDKSNWQDAVIQYVASYAGYKSKLIASKKLYETWHKINWKETPRLEKYAKKQVRDTFTNEDRVDRSLSKARSFLFFKYLGGVPKSAAIQLTQNYVAAVPRLTVDTNWAGTKITAEMGRAGADVIKTIYTKAEAGKTRRQTAQGKRLSAEERRGLARARQNGVISAELTDELMGQMPGKYGSVPRQVAHGLKFMFGAMEIFNRETTYVTAFRIAKGQGKSFEEAADYAEEIIKDTHFLYGKFNQPPFARGEVGRRLRPAYTFRTYPHQLFSLYKFIGSETGVRGKYGLVKAFLALSFFGGVAALPFIEDIEKLYMKATGENIRSEIKELTGEWSTYALYGVPGALGVDITGSIGTELPSEITDVLGVPWAVGEDIYNTYKDIEAGDWQRAIEDSPLTFQFIRYPLKQYRYHTRGLETRRGKAILDDDFEPIKTTRGEAGRGAAGFQPVRISEHYRKSEARYQTQKYWDDKKDALVKKWTIAVNTEGLESEKANKVLDEIDQYHEEAPDFAHSITNKVLKNAISIRKPSQREVLLKEAVK